MTVEDSLVVLPLHLVKAGGTSSGLTESCPNQLFFKDFLSLFLERGEGREKERERNIDVPEKHTLVASPTPSTGELAHNPGMCPD